MEVFYENQNHEHSDLAQLIESQSIPAEDYYCAIAGVYYHFSKAEWRLVYRDPQSRYRRLQKTFSTKKYGFYGARQKAIAFKDLIDSQTRSEESTQPTIRSYVRKKVTEAKMRLRKAILCHATNIKQEKKAYKSISKAPKTDYFSVIEKTNRNSEPKLKMDSTEPNKFSPTSLDRRKECQIQSNPIAFLNSLEPIKKELPALENSSPSSNSIDIWQGLSKAHPKDNYNNLTHHTWTKGSDHFAQFNQNVEIRNNQLFCINYLPSPNDHSSAQWLTNIYPPFHEKYQIRDVPYVINPFYDDARELINPDGLPSIYYSYGETQDYFQLFANNRPSLIYYPQY